MSKLRLFIHKWWPIFALFAMPLQTLLILAIAFLFLYSRSAKNQWEAHLHELSELGEVLDPLLLAPPPVENPEENFAEAPIVKAVRLLQRGDNETKKTQTRRIFDESKIVCPLTFRKITPPRYTSHRNFSQFYPNEDVDQILTKILEHAKEFQIEFAALREAARREKSNEGLNYASLSDLDVRDINGLLNFVKSMSLCTHAFIEIGDKDSAFENIEAQIRISRHIGNEPMLLSLLISCASHDMTVTCIQAGLMKQLWTEEQCRDLSILLSETELAKQTIASFRMERALLHGFLEDYLSGPGVIINEDIFGYSEIHLPHFLFDGWMRDNTLFSSQVYQKEILMTQQGAQRIDTLPRETNIDALRATITSNWLSRTRYSIANSTINGIKLPMIRAKRTQTYIDHARIALALEHFRIKHNTLPETLDEIRTLMGSPMPTDVHSGKNYIYAKNSDETYLLYGLGHNLTDEGGEMVRQREHGDWVWVLELPGDFDEDAYRRKRK